MTLPNSVTSIGDGTFRFCGSLTSVTIPDSVTYIGCDAFMGTPWWEALLEKHEDGPVYLANGNVLVAYKGVMPEKTSVAIKEGCVSVFGAFKDCKNLESVTIPNTVTYIGKRAFMGCTGLTSVTIPNSVTSIGGQAFQGCINLSDVKIPNSVKSIGLDAFNGCESLSDVVIPDSVTTIGSGAFKGSGLTDVNVPDSVTSIGECAFHNTLWWSDFDENSKASGEVYINNVLYHFAGKPGKKRSVEIKDGCVAIATFAFADCKGLTEVTIPNTVTSIGNGAFQCCTKLSSVVIPDSVTHIGNSAFVRCTGLSKVVIGKSLRTISNVFGGCKGLTIVCKSEEPPLCKDDFGTVCSTLIVPKGSEDLYRQAAGWKGIQEIKSEE